MIIFEHVNKIYDKATDRETKAVRDLNLKIEKGEFVFIVGNSGSGKTTLIRLLLKEIEATSGRIRVDGIDITGMKRKMIPRYRRHLGVVFQDFRLLKDKNVYENVAFAQRVVVTPTREIRKRVPEVLAMVGLSSKYKSLPNQLSGGEQQRVAIARALVNRPEILLADEPTGNMDPGNAWQIMKLLEEINEMGTTVVVVTHSKEIVDKMKKRVITMKRGEIVTDREESGYENEN
ncbi:MAG: cell division ATP-binding protein FtsE [Lachnospiraceae bacterium]|nr:cell division ATP-binding protein FtsE [Lachnospiraceae bacterium]